MTTQGRALALGEAPPHVPHQRGGQVRAGAAVRVAGHGGLHDERDGVRGLHSRQQGSNSMC